MNDIRSLLNTLDSLKESRQKGQWPELDAIVDNYAKPGMTLEDLSKLEQEARAAEPPDLDDEESSGLGGFFKSLGRKGKQLVSTEDFRVKYALANAAEKLNLPGLYNAEGSRFYFYDEGNQFGDNNNDAGYKGSRRSNRSDAVRINNVGLLPPSVAERFELEPKASEQPSSAAPADSPQSNSELDTDSNDSAPANDGKLRFKDGSTFYRNRDSQVELNKRLATMVRRMNELLRKMNESIPNSLKGYLSESDRAILLSEALSSSEKEELKEIIENLQAVIDFRDDQGPLISETNLNLLKDRMARIPDSVMRELTSSDQGTEPAAPTDDAQGQTAEPEPAAQRASDASGDADATVDPGEQGPSGNLEAFAKSGKGGLANDPDEVDAIKELQQYLSDLGFDPNGVDGKYGPGTINAVKEFQDYFGAKVDGDAGPETIGKIIKLRSIRWGEGGSKDFIEWRKTMTRLEELIKKAGTGQSESVDKDSIRGILETLRRLDEALSDAEKEELKAILDELQSAYEDAEFQAALPPNVQKRFSDNYKAGRDALGSNDLDQIQNPSDVDDEEGGEEAGDEPTAGPDDGTRGGEEAGEAAYKEVTGSGQSKRYTVFDAEGNELSTGRGNGPANLPTKEEWEAAQSDERGAAAQAADPDGDGNADDPEAQVFAGDPESGETDQAPQSTFDAEAAKKQLKDAPGMINDDEDAVNDVFENQIKSKEDVIALVRIYPEVWEDLYGFLNDREMTRYVRRHISKYGIEVPPKGTVPDPDFGSDSPDAQTTAPELSQGPEDDVEAGVQGGGVTAAPTMPELRQMPIETEEDSAEFLRSLPPEVIDSLPPEVKAEVEKFQGTGQSDKPVQPVGRVSSSRPSGEGNPNVRPGDETNSLDALASDRARNSGN